MRALLSVLWACYLHIGRRSFDSGVPERVKSPKRLTCPALMAARELLKWSNFSVAEENASTEGKAGVPHYDGDPIRLMEYSFRVRLRQAREKQMPDEELRKLGPLGLRLVDALRGPAL